MIFDQNRGFLEQLGDASSPFHNAAMGLSAGLLQYGAPSTEPRNFAGGLSAGISGLMGGLQAQKAQAREDKLNAMLEGFADEQLGLKRQAMQEQAQLQMPQQLIQSQVPMQPPATAPAPVPQSPFSDTARLSGMAAGGMSPFQQSPQPMMGFGGNIPAIY